MRQSILSSTQITPSVDLLEVGLTPHQGRGNAKAGFCCPQRGLVLGILAHFHR